MTTSATELQTWVPTLTFAAKLALVRHQMQWNMKEAALACGLPPQSWRGWELQRRLPHDIRTVARRIHERTGVSREWLLEDPSEIDGVPMVRYAEVNRPASRSASRPPDNRPSARPSANPTNGLRRTVRLPRPGTGQGA